MWSALRQAKLAAGMPRKQLIGFGTSFGKFTKGKKFRLHVTCLDYVALVYADGAEPIPFGHLVQRAGQARQVVGGGAPSAVAQQDLVADRLVPIPAGNAVLVAGTRHAGPADAASPSGPLLE